MEQEQPYGYDTVTLQDSNDDMPLDYIRPTQDDSIQLQSSEAIALNGLLSDLEFMADRFQSMADMHWKNYENNTPSSYYTTHDSLAAFGIYSNKAQDMRDLVNKWKPSKK